MFTSPRDLTLGDIPSAMELTIAAGWNQTPEDWNRILGVSSHGCRCIEVAGQIVATTTVLLYGTDLAWVGMVLTHPEHRRQRLATRLMEDALANAERDGICTLKLDATDDGRPLYESLGFVVEGAVERWRRDKIAFISEHQTLDAESSSQECHWGKTIPTYLSALDDEAFGVSREQILIELSALGGNTSANGYVLSRSGRMARSIGPCIATSEDEARRLIATHLDAHDRATENSEGWYWDLLPANAAAVKCATDFGFTRHRTLWRMRRGKPIKNHDAMVYATAGFELG
jgi:GNAT superfamily N-acetyltransferase